MSIELINSARELPQSEQWRIVESLISNLRGLGPMEVKAKKPRPPMTEEHKAKLKAGRERAKAEKDAAKALEAGETVSITPKAVVEVPKAPVSPPKAVVEAPKAVPKAPASPSKAVPKVVVEAPKVVVEAPKVVVEAPKAVPKVSASPPKVVPQPSNQKPVVCKPKKWTHNFGDGPTTYERLDINSVVYIYTADDHTYMGVYDKKTNTLDDSIPDPEGSDEDDE